ncbi:uncharacterized protein LOC127863897 [Dreissena polymorpha]|uniref:uncharacterized protein LOC127863897 n=1 Tax=Dreissena polymorpha TaxID=45954 RepID=UPI0022647E78|nr:uncharacterized protein LOC127863897 [Dreissena polymorpha]XP_052259546.1 uncharacterized protein LOC127863897 [Dreissena polymorpha]
MEVEKDDETLKATSIGLLSEDQKEYLRNIFVNSGATQTGNLTAKDLRKGMQILGLNPTMAEVKDLMKKYKVTARKIQYDDFEKIVLAELLANTEDDFDILEAFRIFDRDGSGYLDREELRYCLTMLGEKLSDKEVDELFDMLDINKDGRLDLMEATKLLA